MHAAIAASQAPSRRTVAAWRESDPYRAAQAAFAECGSDDPEPVADAAEALLGQAGWAEALLAPMIAALTRDPWFEPPFKVSRDGRRIGALVFDCPTVSFTASVLTAAALAPPAAIAFTGRLSVTRTIRAGGARMRRWAAEPPAGEFVADAAAPCTPLPPLPLHDGMVHRVDGRREAQCVDGATHDVVMLVATVRRGALPLMREHDPVSGALLRVAAADGRASRIEMLLRFLRVSRRADADGCFDAVSRDPAFHLRWQAMREWLALDAVSAFPRLEQMAAHDPHPEIRAAARAASAQVAAALEAARCHA